MSVDANATGPLVPAPGASVPAASTGDPEPRRGSMPVRFSPPPAPAEGELLSFADLIQDLETAMQRTGANNPNRVLFAKCASALTQVAAMAHRAVTDRQTMQNRVGPFCAALLDDMRAAMSAGAPVPTGTVNGWIERVAALERQARQEPGGQPVGAGAAGAVAMMGALSPPAGD